MASYIFLTLDTTAPGSLTLAVGQGQAQVSVSAQTLHIGCGDTDKTGYQMKIWGDITAAATEAAASWESYAAEKQVVLSSGDGLKTIYVKVRDDVYNESAQVSASVALNTAVPTVTVTGPDNSHISKDTVRNQAVVSFMDMKGWWQIRRRKSAISFESVIRRYGCTIWIRKSNTVFAAGR